MKLELFDDSEKLIGDVSGDSKTLRELGFKNGYRVHASDSSIEPGLYDKILRGDTEETFGISDEQYAEREGTLLKVNLFHFAELFDIETEIY